jgi:DNA recombination protein RmuC
MIYFAFGLMLGFAIAGTLVWRFLSPQIQIEKAEKVASQTQLILTQEKLSSAQEKIQLIEATHLTQKDQTSQILEQKFATLAAQIFEERSARLQELQTKSLAHVIDPFKEKLKEFGEKVESSYSQERTERGSLRGELNKLMELNIKMSGEAESLTRALRGDTRTQGAWGEMVLENILGRSGLRKGEEYIVQGESLSLRNEDGIMIRPDIIVHLPEARHIIVDSKVSLTAYEQYVNCESPEDQDRFAKVHAESVRKHVEGLAAKKYPTADKLSSPDFVILFLPMESAFSLALKVRPELQQEAWEKHVAIVSPTTLLVTMKMIAAIWKTERQERNALEIAEKGGQLYDKFFNLVSDLEMVGKKLDEAQGAHAGVMNKMKDGKGNLLRQVDMLRELGVKTTKRLQIESGDLL